MKGRAKFTQVSVGDPDTLVTRNGIQSAVQAFREEITGASPIRITKGYGDIEAPGERDINIKRRLGAEDGPGTLQRFKMSKNAKGRASY